MAKKKMEKTVIKEMPKKTPKKTHLSDYTGEEAIELWADIFDPVSEILRDEDVRKYTSGEGVSINDAAATIVRKYPKQTFFILNRICSDEVNGANAFPKLVTLVIELIAGDKASAFFSAAGQETSEGESSGSATENIEDGEK